MTLTAEEVGEALETHLMGAGLYVTDCERADGALHVGYESMSVAEGVPQTEVGPVLRLLLDLAGIETEGRDVSGIPEAGAWEPEDVHVWVFEDSGDETARSEEVGEDERATGDAGTPGGEAAAGEDATGEDADGGGTDDGEGVGDGEKRGATDRTRKGHYEVREGWFLALQEGHLSETDFSTLVLSTRG